MIDPTERDKVLDALKNPAYEWRTLNGIAADTKLSYDRVQQIFASLGAEIVSSTVPSTTGEALYTLASRASEVVPNADEINRVLAALGNDKFPWRTVDGVVQETKLTQAKVAYAIDALKGAIVQSVAPSEKGEVLYATRERYLKEASGLNKMASFFRGRL